MRVSNVYRWGPLVGWRASHSYPSSVAIAISQHRNDKCISAINQYHCCHVSLQTHTRNFSRSGIPSKLFHSSSSMMSQQSLASHPCCLAFYFLSFFCAFAKLVNFWGWKRYFDHSLRSPLGLESFTVNVFRIRLRNCKLLNHQNGPENSKKTREEDESSDDYITHKLFH